ncbi:MAG: V-type ATP synthase subunit I [Spirochaetia bacterium]|nr:V-type ATP synthase subunit I [Spirochaetia bacterium]
MKKIIVFMKTAGKTKALEKIREAGVVHLTPVSLPETMSVDELKQAKDRTMTAVSLLSDLGKADRKRNTADVGDPAGAVAVITEMNAEIMRLTEESNRYRATVTALEPWGNFEPDALAFLKEHGVGIRLFTMTNSQLKALPETVSYVVLRRTKKAAAVAVLNHPDEIDSIEFAVPEYSMRTYLEKIEENNRLAEAARRKIASYAGAVSALRRYASDLNAQIEFETYRCGAGGDQAVSYLTGFVPVDEAERLKAVCRDNAIGLILDDPGEDDPVPTKIKNGKIVSLIQPVFDFLGTVPGYRESDINGFFLFFFSLFFAMIIGDAGYGLIFLAGSLGAMIMSRKKTGKVSPVTVLFAWLSFCTMVWGALSGNWFASQALAEWGPLKAITVPALDAFGPESSDTVKWLSFFIGTVQISIAHIWSFIRGLKEKPRVKAFTELGWLLVCLGMFNLILMLILKKTMLPVSYGFIGVGVLFLILFGKQDDGHFVKNVGKGLVGIVSTFLNTVSMFSDIMSYIRLFAVGLASFQIEMAFSSMAGNLSDSLGVPGMIFGALILLFGHGLNMMLGVLAILVHAVRLNLLEFAGHLGQQWVGIKYQPFKNTKTNQE